MGHVQQFGALGIFIGVAGLLIGLAAVGGLFYIGSQSKTVPMVYEQDKAGNYVSLTRRADRLPPARSTTIAPLWNFIDRSERLRQMVNYSVSLLHLGFCSRMIPPQQRMNI